MPASTLPTRSAPTSAAFVYIPPPTRQKSAIELAPREKPVRYAVLSDIRDTIATPIAPIETTSIPITAPPENATLNAAPSPLFAAVAVLTLDITAVRIPR